MTAPELIEKTEIVVQGFLALLGKRISRTQIVKLVYLADNLFYEATGKPLLVLNTCGIIMVPTLWTMS